MSKELIRCGECDWIRCGDDPAEYEKCPQCESIKEHEAMMQGRFPFGDEPTWYDFWRQCEELKGK